MLMCWRISWGVRILRGLEVRKQGWEHLQRAAHSGPWSEKHPLYRHKEVAAGVWWIEEKYFASSWNLANIYFIRGSEADLLIDTGVGVHQLPPFLVAAGLRPHPSKPLHVVLTHMHFDHSGGAHQFPQVDVHSREANWVACGDPKYCASWVTSKEVSPKPHNWRAEDYSVKPCQVRGVEEGKVYQLGDRRVEVLHLPGHSPGSLALFDPENQILATGDTLYPTTHGLIDWYPESRPAEMLESVRRLLQLGASGQVAVVLPGHNQVGPWESVRGVAVDYLAGHGASRCLRKGMSRARATFILGAKAKGWQLGEAWRDAIAS